MGNKDKIQKQNFFKAYLENTSDIDWYSYMYVQTMYVRHFKMNIKGYINFTSGSL